MGEESDLSRLGVLKSDFLPFELICELIFLDDFVRRFLIPKVLPVNVNPALMVSALCRTAR